MARHISRTHDLISRNIFFNVLKLVGFGRMMLSAVVAIYRVTQGVIGAEVMTATLGVR
ncbi:hypothetical protein E2C01_086817 [Portunus trituberculatus]|uniref:Uncharacterized protein n=1 Tax=Portunus trituberculatus TaxID=210409 RepID=A0A5B7J4V0_PORTR|nr:hypothetical protein [Portunus trituberculatus]